MPEGYTTSQKQTHVCLTTKSSFVLYAQRAEYLLNVSYCVSLLVAAFSLEEGSIQASASPTTSSWASSTSDAHYDLLQVSPSFVLGPVRVLLLQPLALALCCIYFVSQLQTSQGAEIRCIQMPLAYGRAE